MSVAIVVTGGLGPSRRPVEQWLGETDLVVAADSGYDLAISLGLQPDLVVGDFDSIQARLTGETGSPLVVRYPRDKDETDTEIAVRTAHERGHDRVVLIGGGGGRLDHLIALLRLFERDPAPIAWYSHSAEVRLVLDRIEIHGKRGERISFFAVGAVKATMISTGLRWPLDGLAWGAADIGVSNELTGSRATVAMRSGRLILVRSLEEP